MTGRATLPAGWYIITYGLGIYVLNLLIGFLSPQADPESDGPMLPTSKAPGLFMRTRPRARSAGLGVAGLLWAGGGGHGCPTPPVGATGPGPFATA